jgi:hypothetical protein
MIKSCSSRGPQSDVKPCFEQLTHIRFWVLALLSVLSELANSSFFAEFGWLVFGRKYELV